MPVWSTACLDWEKRVVAGSSLITFPPLFPSEAEGGLAVFNELKVVDMPGHPAMGEVSRDWIKDFVASIFGSYDPDTGRRLIQEFFLLISKKNTKSTTAAGIMITALIRNWRTSAEFLILAPTKEIADNSFFPARDMCKYDEELDSLMYVRDNIRTITNRTTGATLKVLAADSDTVGGKKATGILVDELWLFGKDPKAQNMLREATGGLASRPEGFTIYLSTQADQPPQGVFRQKLQYARGVRDGRIKDNKFLPILYEFPQKMLEKNEHMKPENFYITNPNLGASVDVEFINRLMEQAAIEGEDSVSSAIAKHLDVEIGMARLTDRWVGGDFWLQNAEKDLTLDEILRRSEIIVAGIDGGGLDDLLGLALVGRCRYTRHWLHWGRAWAHEIVFERRKELVTSLQEFAQLKEIAIVSKPGDDVAELGKIICRVRDAGLLPEKQAIGVDAAGIGDVIDELTGPACNIPLEMIIGISQGWRLNSAIKTTERALAGNTLRHCGQKFMAYCVSQAKTEPRGNAIAVTKQASGSAKIDPVMALFDAVSLMALNPAAVSSIADFLKDPIIT